MKRYALNITAALFAFACGISCAVMLDGSVMPLSGRAKDFILAPLTLVPSAVCFGQAFPGKRGLRQRAPYNLLMLSLSGIMFIVGAFLLFVILVSG